jgi:predicted thioesterase
MMVHVANSETKFKVVYHSVVQMHREPYNRDPALKYCIMAYCKINGLDAHILWNLGTTSMASVLSEFINVAQLEKTVLVKSLPLQLACVGSQLQINHQVNTTVQVGLQNVLIIAKAVNIACYNVVFDIMFMHTHNVILDFTHNIIIFNGKIIPTLKEGGKLAIQAKTCKPFAKKNSF